MNRRIEILRIINNMMLLYLLPMVIFTSVGVTKSRGLILGCLMVSLFVPVSEAIQLKFSNPIIFILLHIAAIMAFSSLARRFYSGMAFGEVGLIIADGSEISAGGAFFAGMIMAVMTGLAIYGRLRDQAFFYPDIFEVAVFLLFLFVCNISGAEGGKVTVLICEVIWAFLLIFYRNAKETVDALVPFKDRSRVPYGAIRRNNADMMTISVIIASVFIFICVLFDYGEQILRAIKGVIVSVLRWIFSHFEFKEEVGEPQPMPQMQGGGGGFMLPEDHVDDSIWHKLWDILYVVVTIVVCIAVFILVVKGIQAFLKNFSEARIGIKGRLSRDKVEYLSPLDDKGRSSKAEKNRIAFGERLSNRGRIRLMFKNYIKKGRGFSEVTGMQSPSEMEKTAYGYEQSEACRLYEKARYSGLEITAEDVKAMKGQRA